MTRAIPLPPRLVGVALSLLALGGCQDARPNLAAADAPLPPGGLRQTYKPPPGFTPVPTSDAVAYRCPEPACPGAATVTIKTVPTLARRPDPDALRHFVDVDMPKQFRANAAHDAILSDGKDVHRLVSAVIGRAKGFVSIHQVLDGTENGRPRAVEREVLFAGPSNVIVQADAVARAAAKRYLAAALDNITLVEGPPVP